MKSDITPKELCVVEIYENGILDKKYIQYFDTFLQQIFTGIDQNNYKSSGVSKIEINVGGKSLKVVIIEDKDLTEGFLL